MHNFVLVVVFLSKTCAAPTVQELQLRSDPGAPDATAGEDLDAKLLGLFDEEAVELLLASREEPRCAPLRDVDDGLIGIVVGPELASPEIFVGRSNPHVVAVRDVLRELASRLEGKGTGTKTLAAKRYSGTTSYHGTYNWTQRSRGQGSSDVYRPRITAKGPHGKVTDVVMLAAAPFLETATG